MSLTHIYCYVDDIISAVQGGPEFQHRVFDGSVCALKWILPLLMGESKYLVGIKKLLTEEGDWTCIKEVLGWNIETEGGSVALLERKLQEILTLVDILATQRRMGQNELERLVGKLCSMHLVLPEAVAHLYHIQRALSQGGLDVAYLSPAFHRLISKWRTLAVQTESRPTHMAKIICREPTHLGF